MPIAGIGVRIPDKNQVIVTTGITIRSGAETIGFIISISQDGTRRVERIRELSAHTAGRVVEQSWGPEDLTLRCSGFALYKKNLLGILTGGTVPIPPPDVFHSLNLQYIPFDIYVDELHPVTGDLTTIMYGGCMITNYSHPIAIRDLYVTETATVQPQYVTTKSPVETEDFPAGTIK